MDRETFRLLAYGHYCFTHLQDTIEKDPMQKYVDGAIWAYDFLKKQEVSDKIEKPAEMPKYEMPKYHHFVFPTIARNEQ